jgi:hypothetical protein
VALAIVLWQEGHVASGEAVADPAPPPATSEGPAELSSEH